MSQNGTKLADPAKSGEEVVISSPSADFRMTKSFWDEFIAKQWNAVPVVIRSPFAIPLLTEEQAFHIMRRASDDKQKPARNEKYVFIDGGKLLCDVYDYLPQATDTSLEYYTTRLNRVMNGRDITILLPKLQVYDSSLWMRARTFLKPLYQRIGIPASAADLDMFYGQYKRTPHGIHRDETSNFTYVISGTKKMLFWPGEAFPRETGRMMETTHFEDYLENAIELTAAAGDLMYWPASYWHMAISDGGWPLTLNMNSYLFRHPLHALFQILSTPALTAYLNSKCQPSLLFSADLSSGVPSPSMPEQLRLLQKLLADLAAHERFQEATEEVWFRKVSATGFETVPPPADTPELGDESILFSNPDFPILLVTGKNGHVKLFANGHAFETTLDADLEAMILQLNTGNRIRVGTLLSTCVASNGPVADRRERLRNTLANLCSFRALTLE